MYFSILFISLLIQIILTVANINSGHALAERATEFGLGPDIHVDDTDGNNILSRNSESIIWNPLPGSTNPLPDLTRARLLAKHGEQMPYGRMPRAVPNGWPHKHHKSSDEKPPTLLIRRADEGNNKKANNGNGNGNGRNHWLKRLEDRWRLLDDRFPTPPPPRRRTPQLQQRKTVKQKLGDFFKGCFGGRCAPPRH